MYLKMIIKTYFFMIECFDHNSVSNDAQLTWQEISLNRKIIEQNFLWADKHAFHNCLTINCRGNLSLNRDQ